MAAVSGHPLDALTADEVRHAVELVRADPRYEADAVFVHVRLHEPAKDTVSGHTAGAPVDREVEALLVPPARLEAIEVVVSVTGGAIRSWTTHEGMRPALLFGESMNAIIGVKEHPDWQAALRRRGIERLRPRADRPVARRLVRRGTRSRPAHQPLHLVPA